MTTAKETIKARTNILALAHRLDNISAACRLAKFNRSRFYQIKKAFIEFGEEGLAPKPRPKARTHNKTPPQVEQQILDMTECFPSYSYIRISERLNLIGICVAPSTVRAVWQRVDLTNHANRLLWLENRAVAQDRVLPGGVSRLLKEHPGRDPVPRWKLAAA